MEDGFCCPGLGLGAPSRVTHRLEDIPIEGMVSVALVLALVPLQKLPMDIKIFQWKLWFMLHWSWPWCPFKSL